jgi:hypothetical protein
VIFVEFFSGKCNQQNIDMYMEIEEEVPPAQHEFPRESTPKDLPKDLPKVSKCQISLSDEDWKIVNGASRTDTDIVVETAAPVYNNSDELSECDNNDIEVDAPAHSEEDIELSKLAVYVNSLNLSSISHDYDAHTGVVQEALRQLSELCKESMDADVADAYERKWSPDYVEEPTEDEISQEIYCR